MLPITPYTGLCLIALVASAAPPGWDWPIAAPHPLVRPYIAPATAYSSGHRGIDIEATGSAATGSEATGSAATGSELVRAPADGVVNFVGFVVDRPVLSLRHSGGLISSFEPVTSSLSRGDTVVRGQVIGEVQVGHCARRCLHFGVRLDAEYVSPLNYLTGIPRAILLPTRRH